MTDVTKILDGLNEQQAEAVVAPPGPLMITAGAGSGKTTVLTRRIAWLVEAAGVSRHRIIAVTFTNKAAREMKSRVNDLLGADYAPYQIATFHGFSNRFLRIYHEAAGLPKDFTILDQDDQKSFIGRLIEGSQLSTKSATSRDIQNYINRKKEQQLRAAQAHLSGEYRDRLFAPIYEIYERECNARGLVDFAEIILRTVEVMQRNEFVRNKNRDRYLHVLVDEFQDTNPMQIEWLKLFGSHSNYVTAVGDEDQSIYGWRGAVAKNMLDFMEIFPNAKLIRLEQNYRSTQTILSAANAVISNNKDRFEKNLWSDREGGHQIKLHPAYDNRDEAQYVAKKILDHHEAGTAFSDMAVLYRTHAQSRVFEGTLASHRIPFRIYGGVRFFSRMEVKHALAYLRLIVDSDNNPAFERVINEPARGVGAVAMNRIIEVARNQGVSFMGAAKMIVDDPSEQKRIQTPLKKFIEIIDSLQVESAGLTLSRIIALVNERSGLREHYTNKNTEQDKSRVENLDELVNSGENFIRTVIDNQDFETSFGDDVGAIAPFLDSVTLDAGDTYDDNPDLVQMMTLHQAKGLEFPVVFLVGMDEQILPHANAIANYTGQRDAIDEERRLCYVGMTRAEDHLYLTRATLRQVMGRWTNFRPSRFLREIPKKYYQISKFEDDDVNSDSNAEATVTNIEDEVDSLPGRLVRHRKFGEGTVIYASVEHACTLIRINFDNVGEKVLVMDQAALEFIDN